MRFKKKNRGERRNLDRQRSKKEKKRKREKKRKQKKIKRREEGKGFVDTRCRSEGAGRNADRETQAKTDRDRYLREQSGFLVVFFLKKRDGPIKLNRRARELVPDISSPFCDLVQNLEHELSI